VLILETGEDWGGEYKNIAGKEINLSLTLCRIWHKINCD
jgi:hypothetical protein